MSQLADGLFQVWGFPPNAVNIYLADDILIDSGSCFDLSRIKRQIQGRAIRGHALTHAHPDHQGCSKQVCDLLGIPLWCGAKDADAVESGNLLSSMTDSAISRFVAKYFSGPACPVEKRLVEGDRVGSFTVLDTPGHSPGHIAFWREPDRTLILGDVLNGMNLYTSLPGLHEPLVGFTPDPALNRESARKLAALRPELICFGHGPPLRDGKKFVEFVERLPVS